MLIHPASILALGALGGFLNHLYTHNNSLLLPHARREEEGGQTWAAGFLAEIFLGMGGALVGVYLLVGNQDLPRQIAVALLGGFSGGTLLAQNAVNLERQRAEAFRDLTDSALDTLEKATGATPLLKPALDNPPPENKSPEDTPPPEKSPSPAPLKGDSKEIVLKPEEFQTARRLLSRMGQTASAQEVASLRRQVKAILQR